VRKLVVDASVAIKWLNPSEALADRANTVRDDYEQGQISLLVPAFWDYEVTNGINKAVARGDLSEQEGREQESYDLARKYQRSVYDSWYLSLAEEIGCEFWTADRRLYNAVKDNLGFVKWIGDYRVTGRMSDA
jgi:predicted nucleic acid-binding protein